jgi:hypothetical protein
MRLLQAIIALALASAAPAFAAGAAPSATGLPGTTWSVDCKQPASSTNYYLVYSVNKDGLLVESLRGGNMTKDRTIRNIQVISKTWLLYTLDDTDGDEVNILVFTDAKGRKKSWWSVAKNGQAYIIDGKFPNSNGGPPWFSQCK